MKIRLFNHLCAGLVAIVLATSCSSPVKYTNAIPAESTEIVSIDLQSLAVKAGVNDPQNAETLQKLSQTLTSGVSADAQKALETILKKPSESGIDFAQPVYIFHSSETKQQGFIAAVANADKLKDMLQATQSETQMADVAEKDGYSFSYNDQAFVAFNASTLLVLPSADTPDIAQMHQNASNLLSQSSEQSINSQEAFRQMQETKGDIRVMMTTSSLFKLHPDPMLMAMADSMNLQNIKYVGGLSFEPGQVAVNVGYTSDDPKALELLEKQLKATRPIQNTFAPYFPQSTLLYFSLGLDGKELYTHLRLEGCRLLHLEADPEIIRALHETLRAPEAEGLFHLSCFILLHGVIPVRLARGVLPVGDVSYGREMLALAGEGFRPAIKEADRFDVFQIRPFVELEGDFIHHVAFIRFNAHFKQYIVPLVRQDRHLGSSHEYRIRACIRLATKG